MKRLISGALSVFKYIIAIFMMYAGIATMFIPTRDDSRLSFIYEYRPTLVGFGIVFFTSGLVLFLGKIKKWKRWTGHGLFAIYMCFLFAGILNWVGLTWQDAWGNLVAAAVVGALYLRWKYNIYYYQPSVDKVRRKMLG